MNESFKPYTVIDVLTKVYHRNFSDDLKTYIGDHPKEFQKDHGSRGIWAVSNVWVSECRVIRPESIFEQYLSDFHVDIVISAKVRLEEVIPGYHNRNRNNVTKITARLRYCLDLQPCHLSCRFEKVVTNENEALINKPAVIHVDKYLLPVLKGTDYSRLADFILKEYYPEIYGKDERVDPGLWLKRMNTTVCYGIFPEEGVLGEYFFGFGNADIFDPETGETKNTYIDPGTVVVNHTLVLGLIFILSDRTSPVIQKADTLTVAYGTEISISDLATVTDNSDKNPEFVIEKCSAGNAVISDDGESIVINDVGTFSVTLFAKDESSNSVSEVVEVISVDQTAPEIIVNEDIKANTSDDISVEKIAAARDEIDEAPILTIIACSGNSEIKNEGNAVRFNEPGEYTVGLMSTDQAGNSTKNTVTVTAIRLFLSGPESVLYSVKLSFLYRRVLLELIGVDYSNYRASMRDLIVEWNEWNGILDAFLNKLV